MEPLSPFHGARAWGEPRVLVALDTRSAWSRGVLQGFFRVAREQGWRVLHYHPETDPPWLAQEFSPTVAVLGPVLRGDGPETSNVPIVVSVNVDRSQLGVASVCVDERLVADLAVSHFVARGVKHLTTFRLDHSELTAVRESAFRRACADIGGRLVPGWQHEGSGADDSASIEAWLRGLPRPSGVFACSDTWGRVVAQYAHSAGLRIPEDLALLGVDNDTVECELMAPPLSSVAIAWTKMGEAAAELVRAALAGQSISGRRVMLEPVDVVTRRSSDTCAIADALVKQAVDWIQNHADRRITVAMVATAAKTTRQRLERRFRAQLGRTVMQEVRRTHVEAAKRLLAASGMNLPEVARRSGFSTAALLNEAFRREIGLTPGEYRRRARGLLGACAYVRETETARSAND